MIFKYKLFDYVNIKKLKFLKESNKLGQICFYLGTFFLASALPIGATLYLIAICNYLLSNKTSIIKDKWNISLFLISILMLLSLLNFTFFNLDEKLYVFNKSISWVSLLNWYPLFLVFISFQKYLKTATQRLIYSKFLIAGTIPVLISCILQYFFKIFGPIEVLGGLIVWFNKPFDPIYQGVSGLFSNPNYTGFWLTVSLPLLITLLTQYKIINFKKSILLIIFSSSVYFIILSQSRNAIIGLISSLLFIFGIKKFLLILLGSILFFLFIDFLNTFQILNFDLSNKFLLNNYLSKVNFNISENLFNIIRLNLWTDTIKFISRRPILGYGAATFPIIYFSSTKNVLQHTHNMPLQIAFEYGIVVSTLLTFFVSFLFFKGFLINSKLNIDRKLKFENQCWLASALIAIIHHLSDITYYDGKISIFIWTILAGLKCIIDENLENTHKIKN